MAFLGIDIGTTHCKAALFDKSGAALRIAARNTETRQDARGFPYYDPETLWLSVAAAVAEAVAGQGAQVTVVGIASMAEAGLLLDRRTLAPRSPVFPWFDTRAMAQFERLQAAADPHEWFARSGAHPIFKVPLARLLWLKEQDPSLLPGSVWLSVADYIACCLTGALGTDYSLAGRTGAFDIRLKAWDAAWLVRWGLDPSLFPYARPGGTVLGRVQSAAARETGLSVRTLVSVAGHDHLCAAVGAGAVEANTVFDSMGTAETLVGTLDEHPLGEAEYRSGLAYGCHVLPGRLYWMGAVSASGGSVEWLRSRLGSPPLSYAELDALLAGIPAEPTGILYFPYLAGSGPPRPDPLARAAFAGLSAGHDRAALLRGVLEGVAYEMESVRRAAERAAGQPIDHLVAAGGGTRNRPWLQIKADVSACRIDLTAISEAALLGAALLAATGAAVFRDLPEALASAASATVETFWPNPERHALYRHLYEQGYLPLQEALRACDRALAPARAASEFGQSERRWYDTSK